MNIFLKYCFLGIVGLILTVSSFSPGSAERVIPPVEQGSHDGRLLIKDSIVSANLRNTPLLIILQQIQEQSYVWFKGGESVFEEKVSIQFKDLSLEDGLKRILASLNYSLVFDSNGRLSGLIILGRSKAGRDMAVTDKKRSSYNTLKRNAIRASAEIVGNPQSPDNPKAKPKIRRIIRNRPAPVNSNAIPITTPRITPHLEIPMPPANPNAGRRDKSGISRHLKRRMEPTVLKE